MPFPDFAPPPPGKGALPWDEARRRFDGFPPCPPDYAPPDPVEADRIRRRERFARFVPITLITSIALLALGSAAWVLS